VRVATNVYSKKMLEKQNKGLRVVYVWRRY